MVKSNTATWPWDRGDGEKVHRGCSNNGGLDSELMVATGVSKGD